MRFCHNLEYESLFCCEGKKKPRRKGINHGLRAGHGVGSADLMDFRQLAVFALDMVGRSRQSIGLWLGLSQGLG